MSKVLFVSVVDYYFHLPLDVLNFSVVARSLSRLVLFSERLRESGSSAPCFWCYLIRRSDSVVYAFNVIVTFLRTSYLAACCGRISLCASASSFVSDLVVAWYRTLRYVRIQGRGRWISRVTIDGNRSVCLQNFVRASAGFVTSVPSFFVQAWYSPTIFGGPRSLCDC